MFSVVFQRPAPLLQRVRLTYMVSCCRRPDAESRHIRNEIERSGVLQRVYLGQGSKDVQLYFKVRCAHSSRIVELLVVQLDSGDSCSDLLSNSLELNAYPLWWGQAHSTNCKTQAREKCRIVSVHEVGQERARHFRLSRLTLPRPPPLAHP